MGFDGVFSLQKIYQHTKSGIFGLNLRPNCGLYDAVMKYRVVVIGGAGFIGSNLVRELLNLNNEVIVLDNFSSGSIKNLKDMACQIIDGDITDFELVQRVLRGADYVFHCAARGSVPRSVADPIGTLNTNIRGTENVLEALKYSKTKLTFLSSSSVYGSNKLQPKEERMWLSPLSPYAASKLAGEALVQSYKASYGLNAITYRLFNVYGPFQRPDMEYSAVIPKWILSAEKSNSINVFGNGEVSRDFTYVGDVVKILVLGMKKDIDLDHPINLAFGNRITLNEVALKLKNYYPNLHINHLDPRPTDVRESSNNPKLLRTFFPSMEPKKFEIGFAETITWIKMNYTKDTSEKNH